MTVAAAKAAAVPLRTARRPSRTVAATAVFPLMFAAPARSEMTLDQMINGVWEELSAHASVSCLVCGGTMRPRYGTAAGPIGGRCDSCATTIG